jgi:hypothetical protein
MGGVEIPFKEKLSSSYAILTYRVAFEEVGGS